ncbi:hypothetical protein Dsin_032929 [Dipteronia sinensis]|uniref:Uncharacterized protein n=1 Tax=Dipteronia sinensis TaxID=43782 RepID=A0AAD9Z8K2_9ROSI|nr:hypothetical protein Dsin_032929 [Dipteronia sinensis]
MALGLRIFKGRRGRTGHHATCGALPAAGPYLRLSRFQGGQAVKQKRNSSRGPRRRPDSLTLPSAPRPGSGILTRFPFEARAVRAIGRASPSLRIDETHVQVPFTWNLSLFGLQSSHLNICYYHQDLHDGRSARARALGLQRPPRPPTHRGLALAPTAGIGRALSAIHFGAS